MFKLGKDTGKKGGTSAGGGRTSGGGSPSGPGPSGPGPSGPVISSSPGESNLAAFVSTLESSQLQDQADVMQSMVNRAGQNYGEYGGLFGQIIHNEGQYQDLDLHHQKVKQQEDWIIVLQF